MKRPFIMSLALAMIALAAVALEPTPRNIDRMMVQLDGEDWILRAEAMALLGEWQTQAAAEKLDRLFTDRSQEAWLRGRALTALVAIRGEAILADVVKAAESREVPLRAAAVGALETLGGDVATATLEKHLDDKDLSVRYRALAAYARLKGEAAWSRIEPQFTAPDPGVLPLVARALGHIQTAPARQRLSALLDAGAAPEQAALLSGLVDTTDPLIIRNLFDRLTAMPEDSVLATHYRNTIDHCKADLLTQPLQDVMATGHAGALTTALRILYTRPSVEAGLALAARMQTDSTLSPEFLGAGLDTLSLGALEPWRHESLFAALLNHANPALRAKAAQCLALCPKADLFAHLRATIADDDPEVQRAALTALQAAPANTVPTNGIVAYLAVPLATRTPGNLFLALDLVQQRADIGEFDRLLVALSPQFDAAQGDARARVLKTLSDIGERKLAHRVAMMQGYVARWSLIGTFMNEMNAGYDTPFPPESEFKPDVSYAAEFKPPRSDATQTRETWWMKWDVDRSDGRVTMDALMPPPAANVIGYAVSDIYSPTNQRVAIHVAADDMIKLWVNGQKVINTNPEKLAESVTVANATTTATLNTGLNRILVKTGNLSGPWWFQIRISTPDGGRMEVLHEEPEAP